MMKVLVSLQNPEAGEVKKFLKAIDTKWVPRGKRKSGTQNKRLEHNLPITYFSKFSCDSMH